MNQEIGLEYDEAAKRAVLTFPNGRQLAVSGVTREKAEQFRDKNGAEFAKRDCCFTTTDGLVTREASHG